MAQEAFSDYHLYTLRAEDLGQQQPDEAGEHALAPAPSRRQALRRQRPVFLLPNVQTPGAPIKDVVQVFYQFKNESKSGLGLPMPAGTGARVSGGLKGRRASSSARTASTTRRRTKR
jgi:hypothetical protein